MVLLVAEAVAAAGAAVVVEEDEPWLARWLWWHLIAVWTVALAIAHVVHRAGQRAAARAVQHHLALEARRNMLRWGRDADDVLMLEAADAPEVVDNGTPLRRYAVTSQRQGAYSPTDDCSTRRFSHLA
jgi:hypothetical protein